MSQLHSLASSHAFRLLAKLIDLGLTAQEAVSFVARSEEMGAEVTITIGPCLPRNMRAVQLEDLEGQIALALNPTTPIKRERLWLMLGNTGDVSSNFKQTCSLLKRLGVIDRVKSGGYRLSKDTVITTSNGSVTALLAH